MKNIIFIAPPAAGKGTVSTILKEKYNLPHISTGDLLREAVNSGSENGEEIRRIQAEGGLVSDEIVLNLLKSRIIKEDCNNGYILDGFPRNVKQAESYDKILEELGKELGYVFLLEIDKEIARDRIVTRVGCPVCGTIYNTKNPEQMPKVSMICDKCDVSLIQREDDTEEAFNVRFETYLTKTAPLINYYENKGALIKLNANIGSKATLEQVERYIN